ncbi:hypothetical protein Bbelb_292420 [Branchiostoma belcheri]|nr:hypothetical protein Bbelb_292420 [Branchiostoma belcheri]
MVRTVYDILDMVFRTYHDTSRRGLKKLGVTVLLPSAAQTASLNYTGRNLLQIFKRRVSGSGRICRWTKAFASLGRWQQADTGAKLEVEIERINRLYKNFHKSWKTTLDLYFTRIIKTTCHSFGERLQFKHAQDIRLAVQVFDAAKQFTDGLCRSARSSSHTTPSATADIKVITKMTMQHGIHIETAGRNLKWSDPRAVARERINDDKWLVNYLNRGAEPDDEEPHTTGDEDDLDAALFRRRAALAPPIPYDVADVEIPDQWRETWDGHQDNEWGIVEDEAMQGVVHGRDIQKLVVTVHGHVIPFVMALMADRRVGSCRQVLKHDKSGHHLRPGAENKRYTVVCAVTADGRKYPLNVNFRGKRKLGPRVIPPGCAFPVWVQPSAWNDEEGCLKWCQATFLARQDDSWRLLVWDSAKFDLCAKIKAFLARWNVDTSVIPGGLKTK